LQLVDTFAAIVLGGLVVGAGWYRVKTFGTNDFWIGARFNMAAFQCFAVGAFLLSLAGRHVVDLAGSYQIEHMMIMIYLGIMSILTIVRRQFIFVSLKMAVTAVLVGLLLSILAESFDSRVYALLFAIYFTMAMAAAALVNIVLGPVISALGIAVFLIGALYDFSPGSFFKELPIPDMLDVFSNILPGQSKYVVAVFAAALGMADSFQFYGLRMLAEKTSDTIDRIFS
jgi:hypothetical protein